MKEVSERMDKKYYYISYLNVDANEYNDAVIDCELIDYVAFRSNEHNQRVIILNHNEITKETFERWKNTPLYYKNKYRKKKI